MIGKWYIIHFSPIEKYPPVINFIRYAVSHKTSTEQIEILTVHPGRDSALVNIEEVNIHRLEVEKKRNRFSRFWYYISFNIKCLYLLIWNRPERILYYESLSSFAPWWYKRLVNWKAKIYIHYHEYLSPMEYQIGMLTNRLWHKTEIKCYPFSKWVSHTNEDRLNLFLKDLGEKGPPVTGILPNYPPSNWYDQACNVSKSQDQRIGFVYVGGLSLNTMFTQEVAESIASHPDFCYWDIYTANMDNEVNEFLNKLKATNIYLKGTISYDRLPVILPRYDIGIILHKGNTLNYEYNAPNKYFEYYACGLNILYPTSLKGLSSYENRDGNPWSRADDFESLEILKLSKPKSPLNPVPKKYISEDVYGPFLEYLKIIS